MLRRGYAAQGSSSPQESCDLEVGPDRKIGPQTCPVGCIFSYLPAAAAYFTSVSLPVFTS